MERKSNTSQNQSKAGGTSNAKPSHTGPGVRGRPRGSSSPSEPGAGNRTSYNTSGDPLVSSLPGGTKRSASRGISPAVDPSRATTPNPPFHLTKRSKVETHSSCNDETIRKECKTILEILSVQTGLLKSPSPALDQIIDAFGKWRDYTPMIALVEALTSIAANEEASAGTSSDASGIIAKSSQKINKARKSTEGLQMAMSSLDGKFEELIKHNGKTTGKDESSEKSLNASEFDQSSTTTISELIQEISKYYDDFICEGLLNVTKIAKSCYNKLSRTQKKKVEPLAQLFLESLAKMAAHQGNHVKILQLALFIKVVIHWYDKLTSSRLQGVITNVMDYKKSTNANKPVDPDLKAYRSMFGGDPVYDEKFINNSYDLYFR